MNVSKLAVYSVPSRRGEGGREAVRVKISVQLSGTCENLGVQAQPVHTPTRRLSGRAFTPSTR